MPPKKRRYKKSSNRRRVKSRYTPQNINKINIHVSPGAGGGGGGGIVSMPSNYSDIAGIIRSMGFVRSDQTGGGIFTTQNDANQQALVQRRSQEFGNSDHPHSIRQMQSSFAQSDQAATEASTQIPNFDQEDMMSRAAKNDYPSSNIWSNLISGIGTWIQGPNAVEKEMNPTQQSIAKSAIEEKMAPKSVPVETDISVNNQIFGNAVIEGPDTSAIKNFWGSSTLNAESANPDGMLKSQVYELTPIKQRPLDRNFNELLQSPSMKNGYVLGSIPGNNEAMERNAAKRVLESSASKSFTFDTIYPNADEQYYDIQLSQTKADYAKDYNDVDYFSNMLSKATNNELTQQPILTKNSASDVGNEGSGSRRTRSGKLYNPRVAFI